MKRRIVAIGTVAVLLVAAIAGWITLAGNAPVQDKAWGGVDVSVVERYAAEAGREARAPLINTDQGDLLLFVFAAGGAVGGFVAGYSWRRLISEKDSGQSG
ncbi:MAG: cobalt transporter [Chloroflexota bacterium]